MNLFNKVKKGMLESTKTLKEISSDVTEMTRLKVALSKEKDQLEEFYYGLGKVLFVAYHDDEALDHLPQIVQTSLREIKQTHKRIQEYEFKLESLKGITKCHVCGFEVDDGARYCSNCGGQIALVIQPLAKEVEISLQQETELAPEEELNENEPE